MWQNVTGEQERDKGRSRAAGGERSMRVRVPGGVAKSKKFLSTTKLVSSRELSPPEAEAQAREARRKVGGNGAGGEHGVLPARTHAMVLISI